MQREFQGFPIGNTDTSAAQSIYQSRPTDGATAVSTTSLATFSTPWKLAVPVGGGESVQLELFANIWASADSIIFVGITRNGVCIARGSFYTAGGGTRSNTASMVFTDVTPGFSVCTYEVVGGQTAGGTLTVQNPTPDLVIAGTPFRQNAPSQLQAKLVYVLPSV